MYYEPSSGKKTIIPHEPSEPKKTLKDKHEKHEKHEKQEKHDKNLSLSARKKSHIEHPPKTTSAVHAHHHVNHSAEKGHADDMSDSADTQPSTLLRPIKPEIEEMRSIKLAESLIEDYREVLHHAFKNLSQQDPNFVRQAVHQDHEIEKKTGIRLLNLPQSSALEGLFHLDLNDLQAENFLLNSLGVAASKVSYPYTSAQFSPSVLPGYSTNIATPPSYMAVPLMLNQPVPLKSMENNNSSTPSHTYKKPSGELIIPELRNSPQVKSIKTPGMGVYNGEQFRNLGEPAVKRNLASEAYLNGDLSKDEGINGNRFTIFNSMDQREEVNRPVPLGLQAKKNPIVLTKTNFSEG